ncbi:hypothetical protein ACLOJK_010769 [Asimina triloba]
MAGRLGLDPARGFKSPSPAKGFESDASAGEMIVVTTPAQELVFTNLAYCSAADLREFAITGSGLPMYLASVGNPDPLVLSLSYPRIPISNLISAPSTICFFLLKVSNSDTISVRRFVPPQNFKLALLTVELEFVKAKGKNEEDDDVSIDAVRLAEQLKKRYVNQFSSLEYIICMQLFINSFYLICPSDLRVINSYPKAYLNSSIDDKFLNSLSKDIPGFGALLRTCIVSNKLLNSLSKDILGFGALSRMCIRLKEVMKRGQRVSFEYCGVNYIFTVSQTAVENEEGMNQGMVSTETYLIVNQRQATSSNIFRQKEFNLQNLGIGGLSAEFADIFRRAFASRVFPPHVLNKLGIKHVKGMLLYGPPGTGKTLMARQIGKMLNGRDPKIVNGPEVLSKFVGETEKNVRDLFADAEHDQRTRGDESDLHVIIFDEIDAICKSRGSTRDGTGVHDSIVNQLLTKVRLIDGVEALNNVLLIGMTNRKDLLDEALLRPGRLEVQVEISLPDENGRLQILQIHTNKMMENSFLSPDVDLLELGSINQLLMKNHILDAAARTKNFSGAELEGVVKSAVSYALNRQINMDDLTKPLDEESIKVTMDDFLNALHEIIPAFGASTDNLERCRVNGIVDCGDTHKHILQRAMLLVEQVKLSKGSPLVSCLLEGPSGSGKTALAATVGIDSDFPFAKIVSAETMIGLTESSKCAQISKGLFGQASARRDLSTAQSIRRKLPPVAFRKSLFKEQINVILGGKRIPICIKTLWSMYGTAGGVFCCTSKQALMTSLSTARMMDISLCKYNLTFPPMCPVLYLVFEDAYKSPLSIIILDDIERLLEFAPIGPRFSNLILQTLLVLIKRLPPKGKNLLVIGTTSVDGFLESVGINNAFSVTYNVPTLQKADAKKVLEQLNVFEADHLDTAAEALNNIPIKKLYMLVEMAAQGPEGGSSEAIYSGQEKININHFFDCLGDVTTFSKGSIFIQIVLIINVFKWIKWAGRPSDRLYKIMALDPVYAYIPYFSLIPFQRRTNYQHGFTGLAGRHGKCMPCVARMELTALRPIDSNNKFASNMEWRGMCSESMFRPANIGMRFWVLLKAPYDDLMSELACLHPYSKRVSLKLVQPDPYTPIPYPSQFKQHFYSAWRLMPPTISTGLETDADYQKPW